MAVELTAGGMHRDNRDLSVLNDSSSRHDRSVLWQRHACTFSIGGCFHKDILHCSDIFALFWQSLPTDEESKYL